VDVITSLDVSNGLTVSDLIGMFISTRGSSVQCLITDWATEVRFPAEDFSSSLCV
jgi:hypothetical protein